jgi:hypothetical protein
MMFILKFGRWLHVEVSHGVASARLWSREVSYSREYGLLVQDVSALRG